MVKRYFHYIISCFGIAGDVWAVISWRSDMAIINLFGPAEYISLIVFFTLIMLYAGWNIVSKLTRGYKFSLLYPELVEMRNKVFSEDDFEKIKPELYELNLKLKNKFGLLPPAMGFIGSWRYYLAAITPLSEMGDLKRARKFKNPKSLPMDFVPRK